VADYRVSIANRTYDVSIQKDTLVVNGDRISYNADSLNSSGLLILRQPNRNIEAYLEPGNTGQYDIQIEGNHLSAEVVMGFHNPARIETQQPGNILSPMPGLIVDILVRIGDQVKKGQTLLIQEAMKMQMKLRAPSSGIVRSIKATPGSRVDKGVLLVALDPAS
jgi:biotin carboxyl carrier protein